MNESFCTWLVFFIAWFSLGNIGASIIGIKLPENTKQKFIYCLLTGPVTTVYYIIKYIIGVIKKIYYD